MNSNNKMTPDKLDAADDGKPGFPPYLRHELLTQVNAIIGYSEMLLEEIADRGGATTGWHTDLDKIRASGADLFQFLENSRSDPGSPEFLSDLLYFIRTLVTTIVGYADLLLEEADKQTLPETLRDLEIIRNAGHTLVARLQAFVQLDEAQASLAKLGSAIAEVFPLMRNAVNAMQTRKCKPTRALPGKLLVVDDDAISRDLLVHELLREGYQVDTAEGGLQALAMIGCGRYDLLILDIVMPEMNGYQVLEQLKADGTLIDLPVVIISAWIEMDDIAHCIELGAEDYLPRKFNSALLRARVKASLEKKWLREQRQALLQEQQKVEQAALLASEKKFRQLVSGALVGIFRTTIAGRILEANPVMLQELGYASVDALNQEGIHHICPDPDDRQRLLALLRHSPVRGFETRIRRKSGEFFHASLSAKLVSFEDGNHAFLEGTLEDITERKLGEAELRIAATVFESQQGMMITDARRVILRVNRSFTEVTGYTDEEAIGNTPHLLSSGRQDAAFYAAMWERVNSAGSWEGEIWNRRKNGEIYPEYLTITAVSDASGTVTNYVATFNDITVSKAAADEIKNLAFYDVLTGLPNRRLLMDRLRSALSLSVRSHCYGAVLFLDLDRFKILNDTLGHQYGDLLLVEVASRIQLCVREIDTVARLGGDEFVVLLEEVDEHAESASQKVALIAEKIRASLSAPFKLRDNEYHSSPSIGVCLYRGTETSVDALLKHADMAMYQVKESGRNAVRFFDPAMQQLVETRAALETDLRHAVQDGQLSLYYQMQVDCHHQSRGAEVLVRWIHPTRGMVSPMQFIPIAEESSLILDIGGWVLGAACSRLAAWSGSELTKDLTLAVNVSAQQFKQHDFVENVATLLRVYRVDATRLKLELTESVVLDDVTDVTDVVAKMRALKALGIGLSMDDFGTGYSSLSYLKKLPLDQIKIDQSFVRDMTFDPNDEVMVQAIIGMAQNFGLDVIAEGVETEAQLSLLKRLGCMAYQGYLFGMPVPIDQFGVLLKQPDGRSP